MDYCEGAVKKEDGDSSDTDGSNADPNRQTPDEEGCVLVLKVNSIE